MPEDDLKSLELGVEGGRVSHSLCMCIVSHVYGRFDGGRDGGGGWYAFGKRPGVCHMSGDAGTFPKCEVIH